MDGPLFVTSYMLEIEWLLTWFPDGPSSSLNRVRMRGGRFVYRNTADPFPGGVEVVEELGHDLALVSGAARVGAFLTTGLVADNDFTFRVKVVVFNGAIRRRQRFVLPQQQRVPFMINVPFEGDDELLGDTTLCFQGIFVTGESFTGETPPPVFGEGRE